MTGYDAQSLFFSSPMSQAFPRDRSYAAAPSTHNVALGYGFSQTFVQTGGANPVTGNFIPFSVNSDGSLQVTVSGLAFSGSLEVNTDALEAITLTGVLFMSGISGELAAATKADNPSGYFPYTGMVNVDRAVVTSGYNPQFASGAAAVPAIDNINGGILSVLSDLDQSVDSVTAYVPSATTASNYVQSGNSATYAMVTGNVLLANPNRVQSYIQNVGSGLLYVKLGSAPAGSGSYSFLLKGASAVGAAPAADGGIWSDPGFFKGDVSVSGSTLFVSWEA